MLKTTDARTQAPLSLEAQSLTLRGLVVMIVSAGLLKIAPELGVDTVQQIAEGVASVLLAIGGILGGIGWARRAYAPAPVADGPGFVDTAEIQGLLGKSYWRNLRADLRSLALNAAMAAAAAAIEKALREDRTPRDERGPGPYQAT